MQNSNLHLHATKFAALTLIAPSHSDGGGFSHGSIFSLYILQPNAYIISRLLDLIVLIASVSAASTKVWQTDIL